VVHRKGRFRIPACFRFNQRIQRIQQCWIGDLGFLAATPWNPNPSTTQLRLVLDEFGYAAPKRCPRRTRGSLHRAASATTPRSRLGRHRQTTIAFIQSGQQIRQTRPHR
jgi:hypothetical protein